MVVQALCLHDAWDSASCLYYEKGRTYEIDTDSEIAKLTVRPLSSGKVDQKTGEIVAAKLTRAPQPVFQFDRAAPTTAVSGGVARDYTCDECGKKCKSLNELGTHTRSAHPPEPFADGTEDEDVEIVQVFTCKQCEPNIQFTTRGDLQSHKYSEHGIGVRFKKKDELKTEVEAEPITA